MKRSPHSSIRVNLEMGMIAFFFLAALSLLVVYRPPTRQRWPQDAESVLLRSARWVPFLWAKRLHCCIWMRK